MVGAGTMGGGIAMSFVDNGFPVKMLDATPEVLTAASSASATTTPSAVKRGSLTQAQMDKRLTLIEPVTNYEEIGQTAMS